MTRSIPGPGAQSRSSTGSQWRDDHGQLHFWSVWLIGLIRTDWPVPLVVTAVCVLVRWNVTARSLTVLLSSSKNGFLKRPIRTRFTCVTCVDWWPSPTHEHTRTNVVAAATKHRYLFDHPLVNVVITLKLNVVLVSTGLGLRRYHSILGSIICYLFDFSDLARSDAVRLQASFPGTHVNEHCSSYDDIIEYLNQSFSNRC